MCSVISVRISCIELVGSNYEAKPRRRQLRGDTPLPESDVLPKLKGLKTRRA